MRNWYTMKAEGKAAEIVIYDFIGEDWFGEGVSAKAFQKDLKALGEVGEIVLRVNSPGGIVTDGIAIFNLLDQHPARVIAMIDGIAASAASLIVMAADEIVMPENAFMLVHEPRGFAMGTAGDMISLAADLERMTDVFAAAYSRRSGKLDAAAVKALMKEDRLMSADEALEKGFADRATAAVKMAASFDLDRLPLALRERIELVMPRGTQQPSEKEPACKPALEAAEAEGVDADNRASAAELAELCALAGFPQMAANMIRLNRSGAEARAALMEARAKADEQIFLRTQRVPSPAAQPSQAWDKAITHINARLFG